MAHHKKTASALAREPDARYLQPAPIAGTLVDSGVLIDVRPTTPSGPTGRLRSSNAAPNKARCSSTR